MTLENNNIKLQEILEIANTLPDVDYDSFKKWLINPMSTLKIPNGVENIGDTAFRNLYSLSSIEFPSSLTTIGAQSFMGCSNLTGEIDLKNVIKLKPQCFRGASKITSIKMKKIEEIGDNVFRDLTAITNIVLPNTINTIKPMAFYNCTNLKSVVFSQGNKAKPTGGIAADIFSGCTALTDIYVYWAQGQAANAPWGAPSGCKIHYTDATVTV